MHGDLIQKQYNQYEYKLLVLVFNQIRSISFTLFYIGLNVFIFLCVSFWRFVKRNLVESSYLIGKHILSRPRYAHSKK